MKNKKAQGRTEISFGNKIGGGFFGQVFEGKMDPHGAVAIKCIDCDDMAARLGTTDWETLRDHLFAEAIHLKAATHPNVVQVFNVSQSAKKDRVFIATELCDESTEKLCESGPVTVAAVRRIASEALHGLECLHGRSMVHRDLKPGNILMKKQIARLADFGLVSDRLVDGYASNQGYAEHLAPEYFENSVTSPRTDVWAMGMTIFRLMNGEPWYGEIKARLKIDWSDPPGARQRVEDLVTSKRFAERLSWLPHVPDRYRKFVSKALAYDTKRRFADAGQMLSALSRLKQGDDENWSCAYTGTKVIWTRTRSKKTIIVEWERGAVHRFSAYSTDLDGSNRRSVLAGSDKRKALSETSAIQRLRSFFTRTK